MSDMFGESLGHSTVSAGDCAYNTAEPGVALTNTGLLTHTPSEATGEEGLVPTMVHRPHDASHPPRRDDLEQTPAAELRRRIRLAQSLLGHRADDDEVLFRLLADVLAGTPLYVLSERQVRA